MVQKLTQRQQAFVRCYLASPKLNPVEAAIAAGYAASHARYASRDILTNPRIRAQIDAEMEKRAARAGDSADKVLADIARIGRAAEKVRRYSDALRAAELRGKHLGMFKDKVELTGADDKPLSLQVTFVTPK